MPYTRKSAALRYLSHAANDLFWFILPLVLPLLLVRYNLSYARAGGIITGYLAINAFGSYFSGRISDRISRALMLGLGFFVAAAGLIAAAFAPSFGLFAVFLVITALGVSTFHPAMYAHIDETFGKDKPRVLGVYEASGTTAILVMYLVNGALLDTIGTRGVMVITALPALVMGSLLLRSRMMDRIPAAGPASVDAQAVHPSAGSSVGVSAPDDVSGAFVTADPVHAPMSLFILFLLTIVLRVASVTAVVNFLPTMFTRQFSLAADHAAWATGLFFAGGIAGSFLAARASRADRSYQVLIAGALIIAVLIASMAFDMPLPVRYVTVLLLGLAGSGVIINQNLILTRMSSRFGRGEAFGILMAVMTLSGSVSPMLFGLSADVRGFPATLAIFAVPVLTGGVLLLLLSRPIIGFTAPAPVLPVPERLRVG